MSNGIFYTMGLKTGGFTGPLAGAQSALSGFGGGIAGLAAKVAALAGAAGGIAGVFMALKRASREAADMEGMKVSFEVILGSAEKAKQRLAELSDFAASTPFELPEIVGASRTLQTLTKGALATGQGLRLVGDVAAGTGQPFGELAVTIGRLYDGLMSGRPVGEAMARLQELGVVSGDTRGKLEAMQEAGKKGAGVWAVAAASFGQFSGMMDRQSATFNGLISTLKDNISALFRTIGEPLNDFLRPMLKDSIDFTSRLGAGLSAVIKLMGAAREQGKLSEFLGQGLVLAAQEMINALSTGFNKTTAWFGAALSSIMASASEALASSGLGKYIEEMFQGAGDYLYGSITAAASRLVLSTEMLNEGMTAKFRGEDTMKNAKKALAPIDPADAVKGMIDAIGRATEAGNAAAEGAGNNPIFDTKARRTKFNALAETLDKTAAEALRKAIEGNSGNSVAKAMEDAATDIETEGTGIKNAMNAVANGDIGNGLGGGGGPEAEATGRKRSRKLNAGETAIAQAARAGLSLDEFLGGSSSGRSALAAGLARAGKMGNLDHFGDRLDPANLANLADEMAGQGNRAMAGHGAKRNGNPAAKTENTLSKVEGLLRDIRDRFDKLATA
jgi:hypothetical protein